ncbi:MAG: VWA domain-containing protein [Bacteroidaceae bacterium]|nr:VWA domain-containing protein [Bacteroidaceae bacterium]
MIFSNIAYLLLFIPLIAYVAWYLLVGKGLKPSMKVSTTLPFAGKVKSYKNYLVHVPFASRVIALSLLIIVLARPQLTSEWEEKDVEGIDIMLATDVSTSMLAMDLQPNRLEAAKEVAQDFIAGRPNDNIGLTIFAGESFTQCPLTIDHIALANMLSAVDCDIAAKGIIADGTAIGMGIANSVSRLKDSKAVSKVIILLTDGINNRGEITPEASAEMAKEFGVRIYTIGVGTDKKEAPYPTPYGSMNVPVEIDEKTLGNIAEATGGRYFRATDKQSLRDIYNEIDKLERTKLNVQQYQEYEELYQLFALLAILFLMIELLLRYTVLRRIP